MRKKDMSKYCNLLPLTMLCNGIDKSNYLQFNDLYNCYCTKCIYYSDIEMCSKEREQTPMYNVYSLYNDFGCIGLVVAHDVAEANEFIQEFNYDTDFEEEMPNQLAAKFVTEENRIENMSSNMLGITPL